MSLGSKPQLATSKKTRRVRATAKKTPNSAGDDQKNSGSNDPLVATVDGYLGARGAREQGTAQFGGQLGDVTARDLDPQDVVPAVLVNAQPVACGATAEDLLGPDPGIENGVRMQHIDADPVAAPLQRRDPGELGQRRLGGRVRRRPWPGR